MTSFDGCSTSTIHRSGPLKHIGRRPSYDRGDTLGSHPDFAWQVSLLAIKYLLVDYGKVEEEDVILAVRHLVQGACNAGVLGEALEALRQVLALRKKAQKVPSVVRKELKRLGLSRQKE
jgi:hypothetical protein